MHFFISPHLTLAYINGLPLSSSVKQCLSPAATLISCWTSSTTLLSFYNMLTWSDAAVLLYQARLDEEQAALARRQASYARDRDALTPAEDEEHEHAVNDASFKISILQRRLARHEESALQKYYELDKKLRMDPRLHMLLVPM